MAATVWQGYISFGMISVPVRLFTAARESHISFHQIHAECGSRIRQQLYCPVHERVVERSELVKGYPLERDTFLILSEEELAAARPGSSEVMEIQQFVRLEEVDPILYETSYYTVPEEPGRRAYALLFEGMEKRKLGAIAKLTMHQREQVVLLRPYRGGLLLHTLFYPGEVRAVAEYGQDSKLALQPQELELAETFMRQLTAEFEPAALRDQYRERVEELIESKRQGHAPASAPPRRLAPVIDLMEALKQSIAQHPHPAAGAERRKAVQNTEQDTSRLPARSRGNPAPAPAAKEPRGRSSRRESLSSRPVRPRRAG
jgi:DNA end-binding protein Ku